MTWIKLGDKLPEIDERILIYRPRYKRILQVAFTGNGFDYDDGENWCALDTVSHWQPLPQPPQE